MIKIGDFSKISQVPVKTLRYYDEMDLLKPVEVDRFTGYRYYEIDQLKRLYRILALKDLGFSLEQVARLLKQDLSTGELRGMLNQKNQELRQQVEEDMARLERVEARLKQLEQEAVMPAYEVVIKSIEPMRVASVRDIIPAYPKQERLWGRLEDYLSSKGIPPGGACFTMYHSEEPEIDAEACVQIFVPLNEQGAVRVRELPAGTYAAVVHHGPFTTIGEAYQAVLAWIKNNGYRICGPEREVYLKMPAVHGSQTDPDTVVEIQFPVEKG